MRVARLLTRPNLGGPTRQAIALWHAHRAQGVETLLLCGKCGPEEPSIDLEAAGIPRIDPQDCRPGVAGFVEVPGLARRVSPFQDVTAIRNVRRALDAWSPDVVHTHTSKAGVVGCLASRAPVVHTFHGLVVRDYAGRFGSSLAKRAERWAGRRRSAILAVSASCRDELASLGIAGQAEIVLPAVSTAAIRTKEPAPLPGRRPGALALGFVGRLVPIKRPEWFVDIASAFPEVDAYIVGAGPLERALAHIAPPNLHFLGLRDDVRPVFDALDALVLPSRREGFPVVAVEAAARGVPTIGLEVPGLIDLKAYEGVANLAPAEAGFDGLADAVRRYLEAPSHAGAGAARLVADCDPIRIAEQLIGIYERCVPSATVSGAK